MAGSYHGQVHEENLKRLEEFHQVSKKNRYRKCKVVEKSKDVKRRGRTESQESTISRVGWNQTGYRCVSDDRRTSRWPDSIHNGNCGIHGRNRGQSISGIHKVSGY